MATPPPVAPGSPPPAPNGIAPPPPAPAGDLNGRNVAPVPVTKEIAGVISLVALAIIVGIGLLSTMPVLEGAALIAAITLGTVCVVVGGLLYMSEKIRPFLISRLVPEPPPKKDDAAKPAGN